MFFHIHTVESVSVITATEAFPQQLFISLFFFHPRTGGATDVPVFPDNFVLSFLIIKNHEKWDILRMNVVTDSKTILNFRVNFPALSARLTRAAQLMNHFTYLLRLTSHVLTTQRVFTHTHAHTNITHMHWMFVFAVRFIPHPCSNIFCRQLPPQLADSWRTYPWMY